MGSEMCIRDREWSFTYLVDSVLAKNEICATICHLRQTEGSYAIIAEREKWVRTNLRINYNKATSKAKRVFLFPLKLNLRTLSISKPLTVAKQQPCVGETD